MGEKVVTEGEGAKTTAAAAAMTVVLKLDLHCEGCAKKVRRRVTNLEGVETVKADCDAKKLTVTGNVDPVWLREKVESKTKKKVELISPHPKNDAGPDKKVEEKKAEEKPKVAAVSTVTMKTKLHCDGCAHKIRRIIIKNFDGVDSLTTNLEKDLITVIGTMDVKNLVTFLHEKLKRGVEIIPPAKVAAPAPKETKAKEGPAAEGKDNASGGGGGEGQEKKGKQSDGEGSVAKQKEGSDDKKESESKPEGGVGESIKGVGGPGPAKETKVEMSRMEYHSSYNPQTHYAMPMQMHSQSYGHQDYGMHHHLSHTNTGYYAPGPPMPPPTYLDTHSHSNDSMFSDENPNGCYIM